MKVVSYTLYLLASTVASSSYVQGKDAEQQLRRSLRAPMQYPKELYDEPIKEDTKSKVTICHVPDEDPLNFHDISVSQKSVDSHLAHGDYMGPCYLSCEDLCHDGDFCTTDDYIVEEDTCICIFEPVICGENESCVNTESSYECICSEGYELEELERRLYVPDVEPDVDSPVCIDINECLQEEDPCGENGSCVNTEGSYECECDHGYEFDSSTCVDIDECVVQEEPLCGDNQSCVNTEGSYDCICNEGYQFDMYRSKMEYKAPPVCVDIDECHREESLCGENESCVNTEGSYECNCSTGYRFDTESSTCADIDECAEGATCSNEGYACVNTPGAYNCEPMDQRAL